MKLTSNAHHILSWILHTRRSLALLFLNLVLHSIGTSATNPQDSGSLSTSILIGLTLAVDEDFKVLFAVLVFHRKPVFKSIVQFNTNRATYRNIRRARYWLAVSVHGPTQEVFMGTCGRCDTLWLDYAHWNCRGSRCTKYLQSREYHGIHSQRCA